MYKKECILIGKIGKTTGNDGYITAHLNNSIPEFSEDIAFLHIDQAPGELVPYPVEYLSGCHGTIRIKFKHIDNVEDASPFTGKEVYLSTEDMEESDDAVFTYHKIIGWTVIMDDNSIIGEVSDIIENPNQDLFVVKRNGKEIYIPLHEDFILGINEDTETIKLSLPEGLLEIND